MRFPEPTNPAATTDTTTGLPLWQRPLVDVLRDGHLATVTSLPITPRGEGAVEDDLERELVQPIPMPGLSMSPPVDLDLSERHVPPLAMFESELLAGGSLSAEHTDQFELGHHHIVDDTAMIDLDDVPVDAEIVDRPSADALLDRWSEFVSADVHDHQARVDGLYRRMVDAAQLPRVTFGPVDLRDEATLPRADHEDVLPRADGEHTCPQCGAKARIDIHDPMRGRIHLSCNSCFKMWQQRVETTAHSDEPFMRD
jgi:hypothetical protein